MVRFSGIKWVKSKRVWVVLPKFSNGTAIELIFQSKTRLKTQILLYISVVLFDTEIVASRWPNSNIGSTRYGCFSFIDESMSRNVVGTFYCPESDAHNLDWSCYLRATLVSFVTSVWGPDLALDCIICVSYDCHKPRVKLTKEFNNWYDIRAGRLYITCEGLEWPWFTWDGRVRKSVLCTIYD